MRRVLTLPASWLLLAICSQVLAASAPDPPPPELVGVWRKDVALFEPLATLQRQAGPDWARVNFQMIVHDDGEVTGEVGGARFQECRLELNRGTLGRMLRLKTDWIVTGGTLCGPIVPGDSDTLRRFTIPFDVEGGCFKSGTLMQVFTRRYPLPIFELEGTERIGGITSE